MVELVEELVSVASLVLGAVVLTLECIKSSLNSIILGLDVSKESCCQVSVGLNVTINFKSECLSFVCGAAILDSNNLFSEGFTLSLVCCFPLSDPLNGGSCLGNLWRSHVVDVLLNGVDVLVIEVGLSFFWALVVWTWLVALVSILRLEEFLKSSDLLIDCGADSTSAVSE